MGAAPIPIRVGAAARHPVNTAGQYAAANTRQSPCRFIRPSGSRSKIVKKDNRGMEYATLTDAEADLLRSHNITAVTVTNFSVGGYKYTNLQDAVAAAKRRDAANDGDRPSGH